jgi:hypothetical protein
MIGTMTRKTLARKKLKRSEENVSDQKQGSVEQRAGAYKRVTGRVARNGEDHPPTIEGLTYITRSAKLTIVLKILSG